MRGNDKGIARRTFLGAAALSGSLAGPAVLRGIDSAVAQEQRAKEATVKRLAFSVAEYRERVGKVQKEMSHRGLEALLVHNMASVCYLTGVESIAVHKYWLCLVPASGDPVLLAQDFESHNAQLSSWLEQTETYALGADPIDATCQLLQSQKLDKKTLGVEMGVLSSLSAQDYLRLRQAVPKARLVDATNLVPAVAAVKSPAEIAYLREAARISSAAMRAALDAVREGVTDNAIAAVAAERMFRAGSEYCCYQPIVTVGRRSGVPHSTFHRVSIRRGDPVFMELGACVNRYSSPLMRTAVVGPPTEKMERMFAMCLRSVNTSINNLKPGATAGDLAALSEKALGPLPKGWVWHGIYAYSIGLGFPPEWGDCDDIEVSKGGKAELKPGMVFHCSTSIRDPLQIGMTCSETVLITEKGCEVLTSLPRKLFRQ
ncbi:MAG: aminopeptidase P family protein [Planctomycetes bacterium]|nr:aminopeptidase P family protein [Planctomycetota bacterium]